MVFCPCKNSPYFARYNNLNKFQVSVHKTFESSDVDFFDILVPDALVSVLALAKYIKKDLLIMIKVYIEVFSLSPSYLSQTCQLLKRTADG